MLTLDANSELSIVIKRDSNSNGDTVRVIFDKNFEIEERFNENGEARTIADGIKVGTHLVQAGEDRESRFFKILKEVESVQVSIFNGHLVKSDSDAEKIASMFRDAVKFDDLGVNLQTAFGELCSAFSENDIAVLFNHAENSEIHDHYLIDLAKLCGVKKVVMDLPLEPRKLIGGLEVDVFVAPSFYVRDNEVFRESEVPFAVIRPGGGADNDRRENEMCGGSTVRVVMVARLDPDKSPMMLLRAAEILKDWCDDKRVVFDVVGTGILEEELKHVAKELGVDECVNFLGAMASEGVEVALEKADIFVNPSFFPQTWAIANLEAMAAGAAVIAFKVGGCAEYLIDGENCKVPREHGGEALAEAIMEMAENGGREIYQALYINMMI
ncbi:hypothetical protein TrLO_g7006 [Triparma laevis f. longispina]|uniref:Glycosyltransferase n=1 Tax=Triparma laevis f. longispina TaxID=1714387 RepID=A0A9W7AJ95_9STRA|nr:hypothetical protein TrLO_g7006 [Triparma laevis f. longispina]